MAKKVMGNYGEHTSEHDLDEDLTVRFEVTVRCTHRGVAASVNYTSHDSPAEGAEFEFESAAMFIFDMLGDIKFRQHMNWKQLVAMVGEQEAQRLEELAMDAASESGEFGPG